MAGRTLPALALAMAALAAVLLPVALARRCAGTAATEETEEPPPPPPPRRPPRPPGPGDVAAMFGAICLHEVMCGVGSGDRCKYIEDTMRRMPKEFAVRPCEHFDEAGARRCIEEIATLDCQDRTTSLDLLALQTALDHVAACRMVCAPTASSP